MSHRWPDTTISRDMAAAFPHTKFQLPQTQAAPLPFPFPPTGSHPPHTPVTMANVLGNAFENKVGMGGRLWRALHRPAAPAGARGC